MDDKSKGRSWGKIAALGCGATLAFFVIVGICANLAGLDDEEPAVTVNESEPEPQESENEQDDEADPLAAQVRSFAESNPEIIDPDDIRAIDGMEHWAYGERRDIALVDGGLIAFFAGDSLLVQVGYGMGDNVWERPGWVRPNERCYAEYEACGGGEGACSDSLAACNERVRYRP